MKARSLPAPDADARRHSARLVERIRARIHADGWLAFDDFMNDALYAPGLGYYQAGLPKFDSAAAGGDFITAAGLGDLTARCLARQCAEVLGGLEGDGDGHGNGDGDGDRHGDGGGHGYGHGDGDGDGEGYGHADRVGDGDVDGHGDGASRGDGDGHGDGHGAANRGDILEVGGGDGRMAADILTALARDDALPARYFLLETSAELRDRQRRAIAELPVAVRARVQWLDALPVAFTGVLLAVEALDAMPAARFEIDADGRALALGVGLGGGGHCHSNSAGDAHGGVAGDHGDGHCHSDSDHGDGHRDATAFRWSTAAPLPTALQQRITGAADATLPPGYRGEIGLRAEAWTRAAGESLRRGALIILDYGFPRREFYHPQRRDGTLMCHYRHCAHADPFFHPGLQDISAHIDFTAIADAARAAGLTVAGYTSQSAFLLSLGALDMLAGDGDGDGSGDTARAGELRRLTMPHEMGEIFKAAAFTRGYSGALSGFQLRDRRAAL